MYRRAPTKRNAISAPVWSASRSSESPGINDFAMFIERWTICGQQSRAGSRFLSVDGRWGGVEFGTPGELGGDGGVALRAGLVDGGFPAFDLHPGVELQVVAEVLEDVDLELVLRGASRDEVLGGFLVEVGELHPFVAGEMVGEPRLSALGFAADPVAHDEALVGVALHLDAFVVIELAVEAAEGGGVGASGFDAEVEFGQVGKLGEVEAGAVGGAARSAGGRYVVVDDGVGVEGDVVAHKREAPGEVEGAEAGAGVVAADLFGEGGVVDVEEALEEGVDGDRSVALAAPDDGALEAELEVRCGSECEHFGMDPGVVGVGVALQGADEEGVTDGSEDSGEIRDVPGLDAVDAEGVDIFGVVAPGHAAAESRAHP